MCSPVFLQYNCCLDRSLLALELEGGDVDLWLDFVLVRDAVKQFFLLRLLQIHLSAR